MAGDGVAGGAGAVQASASRAAGLPPLSCSMRWPDLGGAVLPRWCCWVSPWLPLARRRVPAPAAGGAVRPWLRLADAHGDDVAAGAVLAVDRALSDRRPVCISVRPAPTIAEYRLIKSILPSLERPLERRTPSPAGLVLSGRGHFEGCPYVV